MLRTVDVSHVYTVAQHDLAHPPVHRSCHPSNLLATQQMPLVATTATTISTANGFWMALSLALLTALTLLVLQRPDLRLLRRCGAHASQHASTQVLL